MAFDKSRSATFYYSAIPLDGQAQPGNALYVGGAGSVVLVPPPSPENPNPTPIAFTAVPAGTILPCAFAQIRSTGTSATLLVALL